MEVAIAINTELKFWKTPSTLVKTFYAKSGLVAVVITTKLCRRPQPVFTKLVLGNASHSFAYPYVDYKGFPARSLGAPAILITGLVGKV